MLGFVSSLQSELPLKGLRGGGWGVVELVIKQDGGTKKESWISILLGGGSADVM